MTWIQAMTMNEQGRQMSLPKGIGRGGLCIVNLSVIPAFLAVSLMKVSLQIVLIWASLKARWILQILTIHLFACYHIFSSLTKWQALKTFSEGCKWPQYSGETFPLKIVTWYRHNAIGMLTWHLSRPHWLGRTLPDDKSLKKRFAAQGDIPVTATLWSSFWPRRRMLSEKNIGDLQLRRLLSMNEHNLSCVSEFRTAAEKPAEVYHVVGDQDPLHPPTDHLAQGHASRRPGKHSLLLSSDHEVKYFQLEGNYGSGSKFLSVRSFQLPLMSTESRYW